VMEDLLGMEMDSSKYVLLSHGSLKGNDSDIKR